MKIIDLIINIHLGTEEMGEHPQKYEPTGKYFDMLQWLKLTSLIFECTSLKPNKSIKSKWIRYIIDDINIQVENIFHEAMSVPPMYSFTMVKLSDDYRILPKCLIRKYNLYGMNI